MTTIEWHTRAEQIDAGLWRACFPPPLEGKWWYQSLEESNLEEQFVFYYGLVKEDTGGNLKEIGIVPAFLMDVPLELIAPQLVVSLFRAGGFLTASLLHQRTFFIGSPCADEGTIGLIKGQSLKRLAPDIQKAAIAQAKKLSASMVTWKDFAEQDFAALEELDRAPALTKTISYPGTKVELNPEGKMEGYLRSLTRAHRYNLLKKLKRSKAIKQLDSQVIQNPDGELLQEIFALFWQTYEKGTTKFERLNKQFFEHIAKVNNSWFVLLRDSETGKLLAFMLCFRIGNKLINKFIGLDYSIDSKVHLYFRLWEAAVQWALEQEVTEIQSGQTGYRAKLDLGHSLIPLNNYFRNLNPFIHFLYSRIAPAISWSSIDADLAQHLKAHPEEAEIDDRTLVHHQ